MYNRFRPLKYDMTDVKVALIDNSQTLSIGECIIPSVQGDTSVVITGGGTTGDLLGVVLGFKDQNGIALEYDTYAAEADNVTDKKVKVLYLPVWHPTEWEAFLDADAETTDNSSAFGNFALDATGLLLSESSYVAFGTKSNKQFFSYGTVPGSVRKITGRFIANITA